MRIHHVLLLFYFLYIFYTNRPTRTVLYVVFILTTNTTIWPLSVSLGCFTLLLTVSPFFFLSEASARRNRDKNYSEVMSSRCILHACIRDGPCFYEYHAWFR